MSKAQDKVEALFEAAVALETEELRADYLSRACPDPELRREVESLLACHENPDGIFSERTVRLEPSSPALVCPILAQKWSTFGPTPALRPVSHCLTLILGLRNGQANGRRTAGFTIISGDRTMFPSFYAAKSSCRASVKRTTGSRFTRLSGTIA